MDKLDETKTAALGQDGGMPKETPWEERATCLLEDCRRLQDPSLQQTRASASLRHKVKRIISRGSGTVSACLAFAKNPSAFTWWMSRRVFPLHQFPIRICRCIGRRLRPFCTFAGRVGRFGYRRWFRFRTDSIQSLSQVLEHARTCDVISFDIFDTLLRRDIEPPDLSKRPTAKRAELLFHARGIPLSAEHFTCQRDRAEADLRKQAVEQGYDTECGLDEIFTLALTRVLGHTPDASDVQHLTEYELDYDITHLSPMPGSLDLLRQLKKSGKTIIVVSDMYYRKQQLQKILAALGFNGLIDHVFVSSEDRIAKHSTRLFTHVLQQLEVTPARLIHIGDNLHSDVRRPSQIGIASLWLNSKQEKARRRQLEKQQKSDCLVTHALKSGENEAFTKRTHFDTTAVSDELDEFRTMGRECFGPSFCAFTLSLLDTVIRDRIDNIYFLSRDGDIFMKLYTLLKGRMRRYQQLPVPEPRYLYVSRRSTTLPACTSLGQREYDIAYMDPQDCGPRALLRKLGLQEEDFAEVIGRYFPGKKDGLSDNAKNKKRFTQLFQDPDFLSGIESRRNKAAELLKGYLQQEDFFGAEKDNAVVDIGWNATVQVNLTQAYASDPGFPTLRGHYFGRDYADLNDYTLSAKSHYSAGFAYDNIRFMPIAYFMPLFEFASCADHGSTLGYARKQDGTVEPVTDPGYRHRPQQIAIQEGILDFANGFAQSYDYFEPDVSALRDAAAARMKQLAFYPSRSQVEALKRVVIDADWGGVGNHTL